MKFKDLKIKKNDRGFSILAVILVIVSVVAAIGIWALSGQTNASSSSNALANIQAATILNDSATVKAEFDRLLIKGALPGSINYTNGYGGPNSPNILEPGTGITAPIPPAKAIRGDASIPEGIWIFKYNTDFNLGTSLWEPAIVLVGVKDTVCQNINTILHGSSTIPAITSKLTGLSFVSDATAVNLKSGSPYDLVIPGQKWTSGCISANGLADNNMYFRVLAVR